MMDNNQINNNNMKRITLLTMLFALIGVSAFAQKDLRTLSQENAQSPSTTFKCIDRSGLPASKAPKDEFQELVIPPASAQVEKWYTADGK